MGTVDQGVIKKDNEMISRKSWEEFQRSGMMWFANTILHAFGWSIVVEKKNGCVVNAFPARVKWRGFGETVNDEGYKNVTEYMRKNGKILSEEVEG